MADAENCSITCSYLRCSKQGLRAVSGLVSFANLNERCWCRIAPPGSGAETETHFGMQKFGTMGEAWEAWTTEIHGRQLTPTDIN